MYSVENGKVHFTKKMFRDAEPEKNITTDKSIAA
jgi:hypothetical protein